MKRNKVQFQEGLSQATFMKRYGTEGQCAESLVKARWPCGFRCPECGSGLRSRQLRQCSDCRRQPSLVAGTIFAARKQPLTVWFPAMHLLTQGKHSVSSLELVR